MKGFIDGKAFKEHDIVCSDVKLRIIDGIKRLTTTAERIIPESSEVGSNPFV
jgi:hypothetical protein